MGTTAYGGKGSKGRAANGDRPVGAASCRREHHTMASCQPPPPPPVTKILSNSAEKLTTHFVDPPPPFLQHVFPCSTMHSIVYTAYFVFYEMS